MEFECGRVVSGRLKEGLNIHDNNSGVRMAVVLRALILCISLATGLGGWILRLV